MLPNANFDQFILYITNMAAARTMAQDDISSAHLATLLADLALEHSGTATVLYCLAERRN